MKDRDFPHTFTSGAFKGETIGTAAEYQRRLKEKHESGEVVKRKSPTRKPPPPPKPVVTGTYKLEVEIGDMHLLVEGKIADGDNLMDGVLDALAALPGQH